MTSLSALRIVLLLTLVTGWGFLQASAASAQVPGTVSSDVSFTAESPVVAGSLFTSGTYRVTGTRLSSERVRISTVSDVTLSRPGTIRLSAMGCARRLGALCAEASRSKVLKLEAGSYTVQWSTTLRVREGRRLTGFAVDLSDTRTGQASALVTAHLR